MSEKRAGGILASSFVAGLLLAAAIFSPRAWDPVPGPYFGLEDQTATKSHSTDGMEAAHAELSARAQARMSAETFAPIAALVADPVAAPRDTPSDAPAVAVAPTDAGLTPTDAAPVVLDVAPTVIPSVALPIVMAEQAASPPVEPLTPVAVPVENVGMPPHASPWPTRRAWVQEDHALGSRAAHQLGIGCGRPVGRAILDRTACGLAATACAGSSTRRRRAAYALARSVPV